MYGYLDGAVGYDLTRYEHSQWPPGSYTPFKHPRTKCFRAGGNAPGSGWWRTCVVVPPPGQKNFAGETHDEALQYCLNRCRIAGSRRGVHQCNGVNVVPLVPPADMSYPEDQNIPWGHADCTPSCLNPDLQPAGSHVCYGVKYKYPAADDEPVGDRWLTIPDDPRVCHAGARTPESLRAVPWQSHA